MLQDIVGAWGEDNKLMLFRVADKFHFMNDALGKGALERRS